MMQFLSKLKERLTLKNNCKGFTIVELMIGTAVSAIVITGAIGTYALVGRSVGVHRQIATMMENQRGAFAFFEKNIRMAGADRNETGLPGIFNVANDNIQLISDLNEDGVIAANADPSLSEQLDFSIIDDGADGVTDLVVSGDGGATTVLVAEGIQAIGYAYAVDVDGDDIVDRHPVTGNTLWVADINGDNNTLENTLDSDGDGDIDINDAPNGAPVAGLGLPIPTVQDIEMVRIWILAQTHERAKKCIESAVPPTYVVGRQRIVDGNDCFRRRVAVQTYDCKNM